MMQLMTPGELLDAAPASSLRFGRHLEGFGGVHGGLVAGVLAAAGQDALGEAGFDGGIRSVTCRFHAPVGHRADVRATVVRTGRRVGWVDVRLETGGDVVATATIVAGGPGAAHPAIDPPAPDAGTPHDHAIFEIPREFVPFAESTEIRPVTPNRPYSGAAEAELTAWIRLTDRDDPVDELRAIVLADALAPSYAAVMTDLVAVPTLELTVHLYPGEAGRARPSPWVLVRAQTSRATVDGWSTEHIEMWDEAGGFVASAFQHRLARSMA